MGFLKKLLLPQPTGSGAEAWADRSNTYDRTNVTMAQWAESKGAEFIAAPEHNGERFFGCVRETVDGIPVEVRGWMDMSQSGGAAGLSRSTTVAFTMEARATVPPATQVKKLVRKSDLGPFTEERFGKIFKGDVDQLCQTARTLLLETAELVKTIELKDGVLFLSTSHPTLCPPDVTVDGLEWLQSHAVAIARALLG